MRQNLLAIVARMSPRRVLTIGFTKKNARQFFTTLMNARVKRLIDVRLNNKSQLAGFTKTDDLQYFLKTIGNIEYVHLPILAPTRPLLDAYKKNDGDWNTYEREFRRLMKQRKVEDAVSRDLLDDACLLCSEPTPDHCHRRLVVEYLQQEWGPFPVEHLL